MIKPSKLRIGSFIFDDEGIISKVVGFKPYEHSVRCDEEEGCDLIIINYAQDGQVRGPYDLDSNLVEPIPLAVEWLERCGMELREKDKVWQIQIGNTSYLEIEAEEPFMCGVTPETWRDLCPIYIWGDVKFVHQLQNLYFALTGEELTIKN
jgi:hypothetical protein